MGTLTFAVAAVILVVVAGLWLRRRQPSALLLAALAGYAVAGCVTEDAVVAEFGAAAYERGAAVFLVGACLLVISMDLARRGFAMSAARTPGLTWSLATHERHAGNGVLFAVLGLFLIVLDRPSLGITWNVARVTSGRLSVLAALLLLLGLPACVSVLRTRSPARGAALVAVSGVAFILSGSRALVMSIVLLAAWMVLARVRTMQGKAALVALGLPVVFVLHTVLRFFRGIGPAGAIAAWQSGTLFPALIRFAGQGDGSGGELAIPRYFVYSTLVSSDRSFGALTSVMRLLAAPVPSIAGIRKPPDVTYRLWEVALGDGLFATDPSIVFLNQSYQDGVLGSLHPTLFGEMFLSGGWWSLVVSTVFVAVVITLIDLCLQRSDPLVGLTLLGPTLAGYLFVARGNTGVGIGYFLYPYVLFRLLTWAMAVVRNAVRSAPA